MRSTSFSLTSPPQLRDDPRVRLRDHADEAEDLLVALRPGLVELRLPDEGGRGPRVELRLGAHAERGSALVVRGLILAAEEAEQPGRALELRHRLHLGGEEGRTGTHPRRGAGFEPVQTEVCLSYTAPGELI